MSAGSGSDVTWRFRSLRMRIFTELIQMVHKSPSLSVTTLTYQMSNADEKHVSAAGVALFRISNFVMLRCVHTLRFLRAICVIHCQSRLRQVLMFYRFSLSVVLHHQPIT